jgi:hypothetical protein
MGQSEEVALSISNSNNNDLNIYRHIFCSSRFLPFLPIYEDIDEDEAQDEDQWLSDIETSLPSINNSTNPDNGAVK